MVSQKSIVLLLFLSLLFSLLASSIEESSGSVVLIKSRRYESGKGMYREFSNGVIISTDGYILTVSHGLSNLRAQVIYQNKHYSAEVVYNNFTFDVAILKIESDAPFESVKMSNGLEVGDSVFLVARKEFYDDLVVNSGFLKAKGLNLSSYEIPWYTYGIDGLSQAEHAVQNGMLHSAKMIRGYSGSPLFDGEGRLVGINSAYCKLSSKRLTLAQEMDCFIRFVESLQYMLNERTLYCSDIVNLDDNVERMKWVIDGLANHYISKGTDLEYIQTLSTMITDSTLSRMEHRGESSKQSIRWAWKTFIRAVEKEELL